MIRAAVLRALVLAAAFAALTPVTCLGENSNQLPTKATKELPPELLSLLRQKKMPKYSPILVRLFKEEAELEVWKQDTNGRFQILKIYPICRWSGDLGPKLQEGDRQAPEGFYTVTPELMNPNSNFYLKSWSFSPPSCPPGPDPAASARSCRMTPCDFSTPTESVLST